MEKADHKPAHRINRTICLPFSQEEYSANVHEAINPTTQLNHKYI